MRTVNLGAIRDTACMELRNAYTILFDKSKSSNLVWKGVDEIIILKVMSM
jgi:hypothetical protein